MDKRKFAVFDIDGTLFRWQLFHELVEELTLQNTFPDTTYRKVDDCWQRWRGGEISFREYELVIVETLEKHLPAIPVKTYLHACRTVVDRSGHKTHYYTRALLKELQSEGYVTIALSGSQQEILEMFAERYGFDHCIGVIYERKGDRFTGNTLQATYGRKDKALQAFVDTHELTYVDSVAVGDSESDIPMLSLVDRPIAFNPSQKLFEESKRNGWPVVVERKNIVYRMEQQDGVYILAEARPY